MSNSSVVDLLAEMMAVYGQLGVRMAGCVSKARQELGEARDVLSAARKKEKKIAALELELAELKEATEARVQKFKDAATTFIGERDSALEKARGYKDELKKLREEVKGKKSQEQVIAEFRESEEYDQELSSMAAQKIHCCWVVAEKYIKTDSEATWDSFLGKYMEAENALARGEGEAEPYAPPPPEA